MAEGKAAADGLDDSRKVLFAIPDGELNLHVFLIRGAFCD